MGICSDFQWDFDTMMQKKKQERSRHRRRRKDGGIDIINDDDGTIAAMVEAMRAAAKVRITAIFYIINLD